MDNNNQPREGELEGEDIQQIADSLLGQGFTILQLQPVNKLSFEKLKTINVGGVPFKDKVIFIRQMSFMINAGLPLTQALEVAQAQIQNAHFREVVEEILKDVQSGLSLYKALNKHPKVFDTVVRNLIKAGEESGKLDLILERIADDLEKKQEFDGKVKGALIYPIIILLAIVVVMVLLLTFMIPEMSKLFEGGKSLPLPTQIIVSASKFLTEGLGGMATLMIIIALIISTYYYRKTPSGRIVTDNMLLKVPIFGMLMRKSQIASFARTFSMLISAGVPILDSLKLVSDSTTNYVFRNALEEARTKVEKGVPLSQPVLTNSAFPPMVGNMIRVGEETGKMDEVIAKVGIQYAKEVDQMADNLAKLMEPVILIVMGVMVGILAIAVYLPIFSLGSTLSGIK